MSYYASYFPTDASQNPAAPAPVPGALMKLHNTMDPNVLSVTGYGSGYISVGDQRLHSHFLLSAEKIHLNPGVDSIEALLPGALPILQTLQPEILLIGTGSVQRTPPLDFIADLASRRIGAEFMDTHAACRTYNILVAEKRRVAALLFVE